MFILEVKNLRHPSLRRGRKQASEAGLVTITTEERAPRASNMGCNAVARKCVYCNYVCGHINIKRRSTNTQKLLSVQFCIANTDQCEKQLRVTVKQQ